MRTIAVIGAALGDEGKGRTVDDLLIGFDPTRAVVVRHNSSAQAGHTVEHSGRRHVFSHFGSGTLRDVPTHLGWEFVINPRLFSLELEILHNMGVRPRITCSPGCLITTPYDTAANQIMELARGDARHGSCGVGFGQTIQRAAAKVGLNIRYGFPLGDAKHLLAQIRKFYLQALGDFSKVDHPAADFMRDDKPDLSRWLDDLRLFRDRAEVRTSRSTLRDTVIFEGAQGLMLDQDHPRNFPHVTRCSTGLRDVVGNALAMGRRNIEAMYVMRPYLTRHGAGPLQDEVSAPPVPLFKDETNQPNDWQGTLRFGLVDPAEMIATIREDLGAARRAGVVVTPALTMTCIDQLGPNRTVTIARAGELASIRATTLAAEIAQGIGANRIDFTDAPTPGARRTILLDQHQKEVAHA